MFILVKEFEHFVLNKETNTYTSESGFEVLDTLIGDSVSPTSVQYIKELADAEEQKLDDFFGGADYDKCVETIHGEPNYATGVQFVDKMGQQAVMITPIFEDAMLNRIMDFTNNAAGNVLDINDNAPYSQPLNKDGYEYKPIQVIKRDYDTENPTGEDFIYDAAFLMRKVGENERGLVYVNSITGDLDWALLYAVYRELLGIQQ